MKHIFTFVFILLLGVQGFAQPTDGAIAPNFTFTDVDGEQHTLYDYLDAGKTVYLDLFATWCGPCWTYHQDHVLEDLYNEKGPEGTDEIMVLAVEADPSTVVAGITGGGTRTIGDWTQGISYPIGDNVLVAGQYNLGFYPTLIVVRPDRRMSLANRNIGFPPADYLEGVGLGGTNDMLIESRELAGGAFCEGANRTLSVFVRNVGTETSDAVVSLLIDGEVSATQDITGLEVARQQTVRFRGIEVTGDMDVSIEITSVNGAADDRPFWNSSETTFQRPLMSNAKADKAKVVVTTDFYPGNRTVLLRDFENNDLINHTFERGPEANGGGGVDANTVHEFEVDLSADGCYRLLINNINYNVGLTFFDPAIHPIPGVEIFDNDGNEIKAKSPTDLVFTTTKSINVTTAEIASVEQINGLAGLSAFPNPATDLVQVDFMLDRTETLSFSLLNALGQEVRSLGATEYPAGANRVDVQVTDLVSGIYYVAIRKGSQVSMQRIAVAH